MRLNASHFLGSFIREGVAIPLTFNRPALLEKLPIVGADLEVKN